MGTTKQKDLSTVKSENENNTSHVDNSDDTDEKKSVMSLFCPSAHLDGEVALGHAMVILKERRQSLEKSRQEEEYFDEIVISVSLHQNPKSILGSTTWLHTRELTSIVKNVAI